AIGDIADAEQKAKVGMRAKTGFAALLFSSKADHNEQVRREADRVLSKISPEAGDVPELLAVAGDKNYPPAYRGAGIQVLGLIGQEAKGHVDAMCKLLSDDDPAIRAFMASALRDLGPSGKAAIAPLVAALKTPEAYVRVAVLQALGDLGQYHP